MSTARSYPNESPIIGRGAGFLIAAGTILLVGSGLRLYGITRPSAWADELSTLLITDPALSFAEFWRRVLADAHPPLYYLLMRGWSAVFGQSDVAARLPSAIFGILMVAAGGGATVLPRPGRLTLMALLAMSPGAIEYAQEARSYALLLLLSTVVTLLCASLVARPFEDRGGNRALTLLTIAGILASYTHYFGFLLATAAGIIAAACRPSWRSGLSIAVTVASFTPWVIYHVNDMSSGARLAAWMADFPLAATASWFLRLWLGDGPSLLALVLWLATLLALPRFRALALRNRASLVGLSLALLTVAAAAIISWRVPIVSARNLLVVIPPLYLAMAALASDAMNLSRVAGAGSVAMVLALMLPSLDWYYSSHAKEQWREPAAFVLAQPGCIKGPVYVYGDKAIYDYLVGEARPELQLVEIPWGKAGATQSQPAGDCPVVLWAGKISPDDFAQVLSELPPRKPACRQVTEFYWAFVMTRDPGDPDCGWMP